MYQHKLEIISFLHKNNRVMSMFYFKILLQLKNNSKKENTTLLCVVFSFYQLLFAACNCRHHTCIVAMFFC